MYEFEKIICNLITKIEEKRQELLQQKIEIVCKSLLKAMDAQDTKKNCKSSIFGTDTDGKVEDICDFFKKEQKEEEEEEEKEKTEVDSDEKKDANGTKNENEQQENNENEVEVPKTSENVETNGNGENLQKSDEGEVEALKINADEEGKTSEEEGNATNNETSEEEAQKASEREKAQQVEQEVNKISDEQEDDSEKAKGKEDDKDDKDGKDDKDKDKKDDKNDKDEEEEEEDVKPNFDELDSYSQQLYLLQVILCSLSSNLKQYLTDETLDEDKTPPLFDKANLMLNFKHGNVCLPKTCICKMKPFKGCNPADKIYKRKYAQYKKRLENVQKIEKKLKKFYSRIANLLHYNGKVFEYHIDFEKLGGCEAMI